MKNINQIIVPTDFSDFGDSAVRAGMHLASVYEAALHVYHVDERLPADWRIRPPRTKDETPRLIAIEDEVEAQLKGIYDQGVEQGISMSVSLDGGRFIDAFVNKITEVGADLVLMGSHGASGKDEYFIGSNTQKVVRKVHLPVLVLKESYDIAPFRVASFATSLLTEEKECFRRFISLLRPLGLEQLHLVAIDVDSYFSQPSLVMTEALREFAKEAGEIPCETYFFRDYSIEAGIRHFSEEVNADVIGISNRGRNPLKRILRGSNVELLINHSDRPVLSIDYES